MHRLFLVVCLLWTTAGCANLSGVHLQVVAASLQAAGHLAAYQWATHLDDPQSAHADAVVAALRRVPQADGSWHWELAREAIYQDIPERYQGGALVMLNLLEQRIMEVLVSQRWVEYAFVLLEALIAGVQAGVDDALLLFLSTHPAPPETRPALSPG